MGRRKVKRRKLTNLKSDPELLRFRIEIVNQIPEVWWNKKYRTRIGDRGKVFTVEDKIERMLERRPEILRLSIKKQRVKQLKILFAKYFGKEIKTGKDSMIQAFVDKFFGKEVSFLKRKREKEALEESNIDFNYIFVKFCKVQLPRELIVEVLSYMNYNMAMIKGIGSTCKDLYLIVLSSWRRVNIVRKNIHDVSLLVLRNVREITFRTSSPYGKKKGGTVAINTDDFLGLLDKIELNKSMKYIETPNTSTNSSRFFSALGKIKKSRTDFSLASVESFRFAVSRINLDPSFQLSSFFPNLRSVELVGEWVKYLRGLKFLDRLTILHRPCGFGKSSLFTGLDEHVKENSLRYLKIDFQSVSNIDEEGLKKCGGNHKDSLSNLTIFFSSFNSYSWLWDNRGTKDTIQLSKLDFSGIELKGLKKFCITMNENGSCNTYDIDRFVCPIENVNELTVKLPISIKCYIRIMKDLSHNKWNNLRVVNMHIGESTQLTELPESPKTLFDSISVFLGAYGDQISSFNFSVCQFELKYRNISNGNEKCLFINLKPLRRQRITTGFFYHRFGFQTVHNLKSKSVQYVVNLTKEFFKMDQLLYKQAKKGNESKVELKLSLDSSYARRDPYSLDAGKSETVTANNIVEAGFFKKVKNKMKYEFCDTGKETTKSIFEKQCYRTARQVVSFYY